MDLTTLLIVSIFTLAVGAVLGWYLNLKYGKDAKPGDPIDWARTSREIGLYVIAIVVILANFWCLSILLSRELMPGSKDAVMLILGTLVAAFTTIVGYFFGSSKGSADKTQALTDKAEG